MKALIGMSGGVDSSVAAYLLKNQGYECIGATMHLYTENSSDIADAKSVSEKLSIPFKVLDFSDDFSSLVVDRFVREYIEGKTPNPCVDCNRYIKWRKMFEEAKKLGADFVATGHYARVERADDGKFLLKKGKDISKDQSYVLYNMTQEQLSHTLFPLGGFSKAEIRKIAEREGFINAHRKDSQDICFIPDGDYASFIERYGDYKSKEGDYVNLAGEVIGRHKGIIHYTIGQRKGLGVAFGKPQFVVSKCAENGTVTLADEDALFCDSLTAEDFNFISGEAPSEPIRVTAKTRYSQKMSDATLFPPENGRVKVVFDTPQRAITAGQSVVIYDGDILLGGGKII